MSIRRSGFAALAVAALFSICAARSFAQSAAPSVLRFSDAVYNTNEHARNATITIRRTGGSAGAVSVNYATEDGTAHAGVDYSSVSGTLSWADGDASDKSFTVPIIDLDSNPGGVVSLSLSLSDPVGATLDAVSTAALSILDAVAPQPTITITSPPTDLTVNAGENLSLRASVDDQGGILSQVIFFLNGSFFGQSSSAGPFALEAVPPSAGTFVLKAVAVDNQGRQSESIRTVKVLDPDPADPTSEADIITDVDGRTLAAGENVTISVNAPPPVAGDGLAQVDFYADGQKYASFDGAGNPLLSGQLPGGVRRKDGAEPFGLGAIFQAGYQLPANSKLVNLIAVALNKSGRSQASAPVSIRTVAAAADRPPQVTISPGPARVRAGRGITVPVAITDPDAPAPAASGDRPVRRAFDVSGVIARVEYYLDELKVKDSAEAPFNYTFTPPAAGKYVLTVIATDAAGLATVSPPVNFEAFAAGTVSVALAGNGEVVAGGKAGKVVFTRVVDDVSTDLTVRYKISGMVKNGRDVTGANGQPLSGEFVIPAAQAAAKLKIKAPASAAGEGRRKVVLKLLPSTDDTYDLGTTGKKAKLTLNAD